MAGAIAALIESLSQDEQVAAKEAMQSAVVDYQTESGIALPGVTLNIVTQ